MWEVWRYFFRVKATLSMFIWKHLK